MGNLRLSPSQYIIRATCGAGTENSQNSPVKVKPQPTAAPSPVPEAVSGEKGSRLEHVELQQDLQQVQSQEHPLRVGYQRVLLVQADEDGVDQDDDIIHDHEGPARKTKHTHTQRCNLPQLMVHLKVSCPLVLPVLDQATEQAARG